MLGMNETQMTAASTCNLSQYAACATGVNLAFDGVDVNSAAFTTAAQVRKLTSYSLLTVYFQAKQAFFNVVSGPGHFPMSTCLQYSPAQHACRPGYHGIIMHCCCQVHTCCSSVIVIVGCSSFCQWVNPRV